MAEGTTTNQTKGKTVDASVGIIQSDGTVMTTSPGVVTNDGSTPNTVNTEGAGAAYTTAPNHRNSVPQAPAPPDNGGNFVRMKDEDDQKETVYQAATQKSDVFKVQM